MSYGWADCWKSAKLSPARSLSGYEDFLEKNGVEPFTELPLWVPRKYAAMLAVDCSKAIEAGFAFRPLSETIEDVLDWDRATGAGREPAAGLRPEREQEFLRAWRGATL